MKCKRKMQKRRDILTILGMLVLLTFILRMWPILLLMLIGVFFYAMWLLFHMGENRNRLRLLHVWRCLRHRLRSRC